MEKFGPLQQMLGDRYRIDRELGRGGFATVYQVWNPRLERAEALKVLAPGHQADEEFPKRFTQEVRLAAALEHASIVKVYDFGESGGMYWYSMQLVDGKTLSGELRERGPMRERDVARIAIPLLDALDYSHSRGIVHRDIKPENVILDAGGRPFLMDFGIAKSSGSLVKTQTGFLLGTPNYVAPEQAQGKPIDGRADLYALGVTLFRAASAQYPFEAEDPLQAVILRLTQPPRPLSDARPGVDPTFAAVVMRALEREPSRRWPSARAMREALEAFLAGRAAETRETVVLSPDGPRPGAATPPEGLPTAATAVGAPAPPVPSAPPVATRTGAPARPRPARPAPPGRVAMVAASGAVLALLVAVGVTGRIVYRSLRERAAASVPTPHPPRPSATAGPTETPAEPVPTEAPATPTARPAPTPEPLRVVVRPTRPPEPMAPPRRPATQPERLTPEPPFAGAAPEGCSGVEVSLLLTVDAGGSVVSPRVVSTGAPAACERFVLEAMPRWRWTPAVDAAGTPVVSARFSVVVLLP